MKFIQKYWIAICLIFFLCLFVKPAISFIFFGSLILYSCIHSLSFQKRIKRKGVKTIGKIVSNRFSKGIRYPIIEYRTLMNETIIGEPAVSASITGSAFFQADNINTELQIIYDPVDSDKFIIADDKETNVVAVYFMLVIGLLFIATSIASFLGYIKF